MEADLQQHYGIALSDLGESLTWRRLGVLVRQLPTTSRTFTAVNGETWERAEHLLAAIFDALNAANWQRGGGKSNPPNPLPRPGARRERDGNTRHFGTPMSKEEADRFFHPEKYEEV